jgi:hypothetical protein
MKGQIIQQGSHNQLINQEAIMPLYLKQLSEKRNALIVV